MQQMQPLGAPTSQGIFTTFIHSRCVDEAYSKAHDAHATRHLWQKGKGIKCTKCGTQSRLDQADRVILTKSLKKECRGQTQASPTLVQLFSSQYRTSQPSRGHETQPAPLTPTQLTSPEEGPSPPAPKKLRFTDHSSPEPDREQTSEGGEEESQEQDPVTVDFF